jgi:glycosyltransferase involved in cell wall biosynthesis
MTTTALPILPAAEAPTMRPSVDIVIPVLDEERALRHSVLYLRRHLREQLPALTATVTIADNGSTDGTPRIAAELARRFPDVRFVRLEERGRGRALRAAWTTSAAEVLAYMDVDLSTDLRALPGLLGPLLAGSADVAIGSRLAPGAHVTRGLKRELISRSYNLLLGLFLDAHFADAQCGFKAIRREAFEILEPQIEDQAWFFDTELLILAQRERMAIREVPVRWTDDPDSRVRIVHTAREDLRGIRRLRRSSRRREGEAVRRRPPLGGLAAPSG